LVDVAVPSLYTF